MIVTKHKIFSFAANAITLFLTISLLILFTATISNDVGEYDIIHDLIKSTESLGEAILSVRFEPGFTTLYYILSGLDSRFTFSLIGSICLIIKFHLFRQYLDKSHLAWLAYIIIFLPAHEASQLRTAIATTLIIYVLLRDQPKKHYIYETVSATLMHFVGLLVFSYQLFSKPIRGLLLILIAALFVDMFFSLLLQFPFFFVYRPNQEGVTANIFSTVFLVQILIGASCLLNWRILTYIQKKGAYLILIGIILFILLNDFPFAHRIREVCMLGIIPIVFSQPLRMTIPALMIFLSFAYYFFYHAYFVFDELLSYL